MSQPPTLPLNSRHVLQQFSRRSPLDEAQFLYGEIAQRMLQRLSYIRTQPQVILDAGCGAAHALEPLRARYSEMDYIGLDACPALLEVAERRHAGRPSLWQRLRNKPTRAAVFVEADLAATGLNPESVDLVWSNMALHWHSQPHQVFHEWRRVLRTDGLAMFSCLGPGTFKELRQALFVADLTTRTPAFVDMHDFGDLLVENGFADPVMDQEIVTLTYRTPEKLLADVRALGGNPAVGRRAGLVGRSWRQRLLNALESQRHMDGTIHLSLEVAYGHAWRAASVRGPGGETRISVDALRRAPRPDR